MQFFPKMGFQRGCAPLAESRGSASGRIPKGSALWGAVEGRPVLFLLPPIGGKHHHSGKKGENEH